MNTYTTIIENITDYVIFVIFETDFYGAGFFSSDVSIILQLYLEL